MSRLRLIALGVLCFAFVFAKCEPCGCDDSGVRADSLETMNPQPQSIVLKYDWRPFISNRYSIKVTMPNGGVTTFGGTWTYDEDAGTVTFHPDNPPETGDAAGFPGQLPFTLNVQKFSCNQPTPTEPNIVITYPTPKGPIRFRCNPKR